MPVPDFLVLPTIVFAQFAGTSLWFAPNAVVSQVEGFGEPEIAALVSSVQAGFIVGTLLLTYFAAADRFSPPLLFTGMTLLGATFNIICVATDQFALWVVLRLLVGVCLAGVYPVGMKIASMEYPHGLGARLGVLVGALTLGTAFPWLVRGLGGNGLPVVATLATVSLLAVVGAILMALVMIPRHGGPGSVCLLRMYGKTIETQNLGEGNSIDGRNDVNNLTEATKDPKQGAQQGGLDSVQLTGVDALRSMLVDSRFRAAAIGYFGHMWELYAFWAHVPALISAHADYHDEEVLSLSLTSFCTIGIGGLSCAAAGLWSLSAGRGIHPGSAVVAEASLSVSGICCLIASTYKMMSPSIFFVYLLVWGASVVSDSAQFSSLCAAYASKGLVGTALTLTTCIGFSITVVSIQLIGALLERGWDPGNALTLLAIGPIVGLIRSYIEWPLHEMCLASTQLEEGGLVAADSHEKSEEQQSDYSC